MVLPPAPSATQETPLIYLGFRFLVPKTEVGGQMSHHHFARWKNHLQPYGLEMPLLEKPCDYAPALFIETQHSWITGKKTLAVRVNCKLLRLQQNERVGPILLA